jgi:hypothetical protein
MRRNRYIDEWGQLERRGRRRDRGAEHDGAEEIAAVAGVVCAHPLQGLLGIDAVPIAAQRRLSA